MIASSVCVCPSASDRYGGTAAKRASYRKTCGVEMGNSRSPGAPFDESLYHDMVADLAEVGFWDDKPPKQEMAFADNANSIFFEAN